MAGFGTIEYSGRNTLITNIFTYGMNWKHTQFFRTKAMQVRCPFIRPQMYQYFHTDLSKKCTSVHVWKGGQSTVHRSNKTYRSVVSFISSRLANYGPHHVSHSFTVYMLASSNKDNPNPTNAMIVRT
jgi:hypothetical protein